MKNMFLVAVILIATRAFAQAPSFEGGFQSLSNDGFGHQKYIASFTVRADVDLGSESEIGRTVDTYYFGGPITDDVLPPHLITSDGADEFTVNFDPATLGYWQYVVLHYRYVGGPDDSQDIPGSPHVIGPLNIMGDPNPQISEFELNGSYLDATVHYDRFIGGPEYSSDRVLDLTNTDLGINAVYDSTEIDDGSGPATTEYHKYLGFEQPGWICGQFRIRHSQNGPGFHDFQGELVAWTTGSYCVYWPGTSTYISDIANGLFTTSPGFCRVVNMNGEIVYAGSDSGIHEFNTTSWASGIYIVTLTGDDQMQLSKKISIQH